MTYAFTYFLPGNPAKGLNQDARSAVHAAVTLPEAVITKRTLAGVMAWCKRHTRAGGKGDSGYIVAGECTGTRNATNTGPAPFALLDADKSAPDWDDLDQYEGFAWTTASHTEEHQSWRIVIPFVEPIAHASLSSPFEFAYIRDRSQPAFLANQAPGLPAVQWRVLAGAKRLDGAALTKRPAHDPSAPLTRVGATGRGYAPDLSVIAKYVAPAGHDSGRHQLVRSLAGWLTRRGHSPDEVYESILHQIPSSNPHMRAYQAREAAEQVLRGEVTAGMAELKAWCEQWAGKHTFRRLERAVKDPAEPEWFYKAGGVWSLWWRRNMPRMAESWRQAVECTGEIRAAERAERAEVARVERVEHGAENAQGTKTCVRTGWPLVLQRNATYWLHSPDVDAYGAAFPYSELEVRVRAEYHGSIDPIEGWKVPTLRSEGWIQAVERVVYDYRAERTTYEPDERLVRVAALQCMPPERARKHADVDIWLRALFGDMYDRCAQWIASCAHLHRVSPCLYLVGRKEIGKNLLFCGLARLWGQSSPVPMAEVVSDFNEQQCECPLVFTDEGFPAGLEFTRFRSMITDHDRRVNRKGLAKVTVEGCARYAVGANNDSVLRWAKHGDMGLDDQGAIAARLLVVHCDSEAAAEALRGVSSARIEDWARGAIAEHALWLAQTVSVEAEGRMCVEPSGGDELVSNVVNDRYAFFATAVAEALAGGEASVERTHVWTSPKDDRCVYVHAEHFHKHIALSDPRVRLGDVKEACRALALRSDYKAIQRRIPGTPRTAHRPCAYAVDRNKVLEAAGLSPV